MSNTFDTLRFRHLVPESKLSYKLIIAVSSIYIYMNIGTQIKGKSLLRRFDKSTTALSHLLKPMDPLNTYRLTDRIAF